jgi:hypothetical protein
MTPAASGFEHYPRTERERYRIVRLAPPYRRGSHETVCTCATPEAVGVALVILSQEGEFDGCRVGVLDTLAPVGHAWILLPYPEGPQPEAAFPTPTWRNKLHATWKRCKPF